METNRLYQFKIVVDAGGLVRASDLLGISAGGLSKSMNALKEELGFELFVQRGRGLELTPAGKKLYERVPSVLRTIDDLLHFRKGTSPEREEPFRIVSFEVFTTYFLGSVITQSLKSRPIDIRDAIPGEMEALVGEGHSDLGITYLPVPHAEVDLQKVGRVRMGIFGLKNKWKSQSIENIPFAVPITPIQGTPSGVQGLDGWPEHLFSRRILFRVEMMETAIQLCRRGVAAAFLPEFVIRLANQQAIDSQRLSELALPNGVRQVYRDVYLVQRKGFKESRECREIAKAIRSLE